MDPDGGHGSAADASNHPTDPDAAPADGASVGPDAPDVARPLYALSGANLYQIDIPQMTSTLVGPITSGRTQVANLAGLGFDGFNLIALDQDSARVLVIDPATADVVASKSLDMPGRLAGLTVIPANEVGNSAPIYLAASADALYSITPVSGAVTMIGGFSDGAAFSTDLAWVHGHGLYMTMRISTGDGGPGGGTTSTDLVRIDPSSAATITDLRGGYNNINGLSGYRGKLWGLSRGGVVYAIDPGTGSLSGKLFNGPPYSEAAQ